MKNSIKNYSPTTEPTQNAGGSMLPNNSHLPRCPPHVRVPTPTERLAGVLADLEELAADAWVDRAELAAVVIQLRRALVAAGLRDRTIHVPSGPGWVPGAAMRPVVAKLRAALRLGGAV